MATMIELTDNEFVTVTGSDALTFLQGQVTCDVKKLQKNKALAGAICSLKGRVIADFLLVLDGEDCVLRTQRGMAEIIKIALSKYAIFSKVELSTETRFSKVLGAMTGEDDKFLARIIGKPPKNSLDCHVDAAGIIVNLPSNDRRCEIWISDEERFRDWTVNQNANMLEDWNRKNILQGLIHINPELSEEYTPQVLNYDLSGIIDFSKGCYTGQEIIARMHYRSNAKKRLSLLLSKSSINENSEVAQRCGGKETLSNVLAYSNSPKESESSALLSVLNITDKQSTFSLSCANEEEHILKLEPLSYPSQSADK